MTGTSEPGDANKGADWRPGWVPPTTLPVSSLTRYLRVRLEVTDGVLRWQVPRAVLGVWPAGVRHTRVPLAEVSRVRMRWVGHPLRLLAGAAGIAVPLVFGLWWLAVPTGLVGLWLILLSAGLSLEVRTRAGARHRAGVCVFHALDAQLYAAAVNDLADRASPAAPGTPG